jgi:hypothetical protein
MAMKWVICPASSRTGVMFDLAAKIEVFDELS